VKLLTQIKYWMLIKKCEKINSLLGDLSSSTMTNDVPGIVLRMRRDLQKIEDTLIDCKEVFEWTTR